MSHRYPQPRTNRGLLSPRTVGLTFAGVAAVLMMSVAGVALLQVAGPQSRLFTETGYTVRGPFLAFFDDNGGLQTFGYPITQAYSLRDDQVVQTFERAHLQLDAGGVSLAPIGLALRLGEVTATVEVAAPFVSFYNDLGGVEQLGMPLGPAREESGLLVQDFERVQLVQDRDGQVRLANLGVVYLSVFPPPASSLSGFGGDVPTLAPPESIHPTVSVANPTVGQGEDQTLFLVIKDDNGDPVPGLRALAVLRHDGGIREVIIPPTDADGFSQVTFRPPDAEPGSQVIVDVHILLGESLWQIETSYFQWW
ncbi:MAG: hypothetical protein GYB68_12185 [Chloroflexi bacterium]|nr:hypothetical protein [Chloroflexota bacterium]